jgi:hypothetical protein
LFALCYQLLWGLQLAGGFPAQLANRRLGIGNIGPGHHRVAAVGLPLGDTCGGANAVLCKPLWRALCGLEQAAGGNECSEKQEAQQADYLFHIRLYMLY